MDEIRRQSETTEEAGVCKNRLASYNLFSYNFRRFSLTFVICLILRGKRDAQIERID